MSRTVCGAGKATSRVATSTVATGRVITSSVSLEPQVVKGVRLL